MTGDVPFTVGIAATVGFVVLIALATAVAGRLRWSAPIVLVALGAGLSLIPGFPKPSVRPEWILSGVLPPLLFAGALRASLIDIRARRDPIVLVSAGLVAFTVVVVGATAWLVIPGIGVAAALAFGAVVAPTDAVAVGAMTRGARLPRELTTLLEGESLLNDATSLVALNAAIAALAGAINPVVVAADFALAVGVGVGVGLGVGFVVSAIRQRVHTPVLDVCISLVTPYVAFLVAASLSGSGVLAVVIAGLLLAYRSPVIQTAESRVAESVNWRTIAFLVENGLFLLIGLSLPQVVGGIVDSSIGVVGTLGVLVVVLAALVGSRLVWGLVVTAVFRRGPRRLRRIRWGWNQNVPFTLAGARGAVTLAAVFLLPSETPHLTLLRFLAFAVVVATLLETLLLPVVVRHLHLPVPDDGREALEAQRLIAEAQRAGLEALDTSSSEDAPPRVVDRLRTNATFLQDTGADESEDPGALHRTYIAARRVTLAAERRAVLLARREQRYREPAVRAALAAIDGEEVSLGAMSRSDQD